MKKEKNIEVERNIDVKKSTKKDKNSYGSRIDILREEFNLSNLEVDGMKEFLENPVLNRKGVSIGDAIGTIIETDKLNIRQKMALSYSMGMFQAEKNIIRASMIPNMIPDMPGSGG